MAKLSTLSAFKTVDRLEVGPVVVEPRRLTAPYRVTWQVAPKGQLLVLTSQNIEQAPLPSRSTAQTPPAHSWSERQGLP